MKRFVLSNSQGGALLFAIVTALVLSFIGVSLTVLTSNQYRIIDNEVKRKEAYYWLIAGMEYANYMIRTGQVNFNPVQNQTWREEATLTLPDGVNRIDILIKKPDPDGLSAYKIEVLTGY